METSPISAPLVCEGVVNSWMMICADIQKFFAHIPPFSQAVGSQDVLVIEVLRFSKLALWVGAQNGVHRFPIDIAPVFAMLSKDICNFPLAKNVVYFSDASSEFIVGVVSLW